MAVSDGPGPDYVGSYMQLVRFGSGGVVSDPGLFDSAPLAIDDGAGADLYELVTYPDPQDPGQQTHGSQRIDVSYAAPRHGKSGAGPAAVGPSARCAPHPRGPGDDYAVQRHLQKLPDRGERHVRAGSSRPGPRGAT